MTFDSTRWQTRLDELRATHDVPGAGLAVLADGEVHELASGLLNRGTGVEARPGSLFLAGSLAKAYTATAVMALVDQGRLDLDASVHDLLPGFDVPDAEGITVRRLLSHTGGLTCDFQHDTGRGDDCVARYVDAAAHVAPDCPPGVALSYSSVGYAVLGRVIEVVTGSTWDDALADLVLRRAGLDHTVTLPEQALRFRTAIGHVDGVPADPWDLMPRSAAPYGRVIVSAGDVVRFAQVHLDGSGRMLSSGSVHAMQQHESDALDRWTFEADGWGLGWALFDWDGVPGFGHDGSAVTQQSFLRVVPSSGVAVALLANGGDMNRFYRDLVDELLADLAGVHLNPAFAVPADPPAADLAPYLGRYRREGVITTISRRDDGTGRVRYEFADGLAGIAPPMEGDLVPVDGPVFAALDLFGPDPMPVVFTELPDGRRAAVVSMRLTPRVS